MITTFKGILMLYHLVQSVCLFRTKLHVRSNDWTAEAGLQHRSDWKSLVFDTTKLNTTIISQLFQMAIQAKLS